METPEFRDNAKGVGEACLARGCALNGAISQSSRMNGERPKTALNAKGSNLPAESFIPSLFVL